MSIQQYAELVIPALVTTQIPLPLPLLNVSANLALSKYWIRLQTDIRVEQELIGWRPILVTQKVEPARR